MRISPFFLVFLTALSLAATGGSPARADGGPASVVIVAEGTKGADLAIPFGKTVDVRLEGRDSHGKSVRIDAAKVSWRLSGRYFGHRRAEGCVKITALKDAFDLRGENEPAAEPTGMLMATYDGLTAGVEVHAVLNIEGKWIIDIPGEKVKLVLNLKQSGRWVKDDENRRGTISGLQLALTISGYPVDVLGITMFHVTLYPKMTFASRTAGTGTVQAGDKIDTFTAVKSP